MTGWLVALQRSERRLRVQIETLEELSRSKDQMLALLAHELRNPLSYASNALLLLKLRGLSRPQERPCAMAEEALHQLRRLIDDVTDLSRIARGHVQLHYQSIDLTTLLADMLLLFHSEADAKGVRLVAHLPEAPLRVFGDSLRLTQVFSNLIGNALKFTDSGTVWVSAAAHRESAWIVVKDTGCGIDATGLAHLFEPFVQREDRGGMGLGLFVVRGFVELHGGAVTAESPGPGHGAAFTVEIPLESGISPR